MKMENENSQLDAADQKASLEEKQAIQQLENHDEIPTLEIVEAISSASMSLEPKLDEKESIMLNETLTVPYILNGELYQILSRNGENVTVKCCSCPSGRFYRGSVRSTGNFHMHIKRRHPYLLSKLHDMKVHSLLERRDRLMKNRKAKLRRILVDNNGRRADHEQHKLKIKRAFQRHQAEAKGNGKDALEDSSPIPYQSKETPIHEIPSTPHSIFNENLDHLDQTKDSLIAVSAENAYCEFRVLDVAELSPMKNVVATKQSTPYSCNALAGFSPPTYSNHKSETYFVESPLDLSRTSTRSNSPIANNCSDSSGIGLETMWSNTTVANTVSTSISLNAPIGGQNITNSNSGADAIWWQHHLGLILRDIHDDIRARNRIEQNRLLLEVAKMKFLHPGFFFNLQD